MGKHIRRRYKISWGRSVYYKEQFSKGNYFSKVFDTKKEASLFISKLNKRNNVDFINVDYGYYPKHR